MSRVSVVHGVLAACVTVLVACGAPMLDAGGTGGVPRGVGGGMAAAGGAASAGGAAGGSAMGGGSVNGAAGGMVLASMYPSWTLEDLQPASPRANQTYGLSAFQGRALVVVMIEGF